MLIPEFWIAGDVAHDCSEQPNNAQVGRHAAELQTHLNFGSQDYKSISRIVEPEYSSELVLSEVANVADFKFWRLSK